MNWLRHRAGFKLDYSKLIFLDAEELAEAGIARAYDSMLPELRKYVSKPAEIEQVIDDSAPSYLVRCRGVEYPIYSPPVDAVDSWARATYVFFKIINDQLAPSDHRFYAINGANDLGGMFLTDSEWKAAQHSLPRKSDWPYLPTLDAPWFGQFHR